jgi:hypothetical protein
VSVEMNKRLFFRLKIDQYFLKLINEIQAKYEKKIEEYHSQKNHQYDLMRKEKLESKFRKLIGKIEIHQHFNMAHLDSLDDSTLDTLLHLDGKNDKNILEPLMQTSCIIFKNNLIVINDKYIDCKVLKEFEHVFCDDFYKENQRKFMQKIFNKNQVKYFN